MGADKKQKARLQERGLDGIYVTVPIELLADFKEMVEEKKDLKRRRERAYGRSFPRVSISGEIAAAMLRRLKDFHAQKKRRGEPQIPDPRPRGRPRKVQPDGGASG